jgi:pimeloyl-ACP methyl ester carboxylesterase
VLGSSIGMPLDPQKSLVFFVPGIMGSVLRYRGLDRYGHATEGILWGTEGAQNLKNLAMHPEMMRAPAYAHRVISFVQTPSLEQSDVYGGLMRFCSSADGLGMIEKINFHPFPYDWRQDNAVSASRLGERIRELDPEGKKDLYFIAHSMGGLVCRLAITGQSEISKRVRLLFQIASPIEGSPKAYWTLNRYPEFGKFIDPWYLRRHHRDPDLRAQLVVTIQSFTSAFQLLPPRHVTTLIGPGGAEFPARHPDAWPNQLHGQLEKAEAIQSALSIPNDVRTCCVYSAKNKTPWRFAVDQFFSIIARFPPQPNGDGTVPASSARALPSVANEYYEATGKLTEHTALCQHPEVRTKLKQAFA